MACVVATKFVVTAYVKRRGVQICLQAARVWAVSSSMPCFRVWARVWAVSAVCGVGAFRHLRS